MTPFNFLTQRELTPLPENMASWMWDSPEYIRIDPDTQPYELITSTCEGIGEFLSQFPNNYIVLVHEIKGLISNRVHNANNTGNGWGFDIQNDWIDVTYYRFLNTSDIETV
jgi:hypothetical protein